jgi:hypothetical protein
VRLANQSRAEHEAESEGESDTEGTTESVTIGRGTVTSEGTTSATGDSQFSSDLMTPPMQYGAPPSQMLPGTILSQSAGAGSSSMEGRTSSRSEIESEAHSRGRISARSTSRARTRGTSVSDGWSEANEPVFVDLPASYHSKENELYFAGERIRRLPTGKCFIAFRGQTALVSVQAPKRKP